MTTKAILTILLTFLFFSFLSAQDEDKRSPEAGQAYNSGNNLAKSQKFSEAIQKYLEAIKADDNFPKANYMLGYCYQKTNQFAKAEAAFKNAIRLDSKFELSYIALGNLQVDMDKKTDAINTFNAVIAFNPASAKANYGLGKVYYDQKKFDLAEKYLSEAVKADPDYEYAHNFLGLTYSAQKKYSQAAASFKRAVETVSPKQVQLKGNYLYRLGEAYVMAGEYKDGEDALLNALKVSRKDNIKAACNFYLGEIYKKQGQTQKAIRYYTEASQNRSWKQSADYEIDLLKNPDKYSY